jgi:hypothetical protein
VGNEKERVWVSWIYFLLCYKPINDVTHPLIIDPDCAFQDSKWANDLLDGNSSSGTASKGHMIQYHRASILLL